MSFNPAALAHAVATDGYAEWPGFVSGPLLESLTAASEALLSGPHARPYPKSTRVWDLYLLGPEFVDLVSDSHLARMLDALLGTDHRLSDYSMNSVNPGQRRDDWHLDYPYNEMPQLVDGAVLGVQCVLTLTAFTPDNGATELLPGTHQPPRRPDRTARRVPRRFTAKPGTLLVMAAATWHRSGYNKSTQARSALLLSFVERWIRPLSAPTDGLAEPVADRLANLLGLHRAPETINGVPI